MASRAVVVVCLLFNIAVAGFVLSLGITGFSWQAVAGVYPAEPVQTSEAHWDRESAQITVQKAVRALDRLKQDIAQDVDQAETETEPQPDTQDRAAPKLKASAEEADVHIAPSTVVPRPKTLNKHKRPRIAIVMDDLGLNTRRTRRLIRLHGPLTLSFLPYGYHLAELTKEAASHGHEVFLHLPMEPLGHENPGPNALLEHLAPAEFDRRMRWAFEQVPGIDGFNNHMGSRLTSDPKAMKRVMAEGRKRHLMFLDSRTYGGSIAYETAVAFGIPAEKRDIFLDDDPSAKSIIGQFKKLERVARHKGHAIAIGHPYDTTYAVLKKWLQNVEARGYELVPVRVIIEDSSTPVVAAARVPSPSGHSMHTSASRNAQ